MQIGILATSFAFISPKSVAGKQYLLADVEQTYSEAVSARNLSVALPSILLCLAVPAWWFLCVFYGRRRGNHSLLNHLSAYQNNFSYFYVGYPMRCYLWDFVRMAQRIAIVLVFVLFNGFAVAQGVATCAVIAFYHALCLFYNPYESIQLRRTDLLSALFQLASLQLGILLSYGQFSPLPEAVL